MLTSYSFVSPPLFDRYGGKISEEETHALVWILNCVKNPYLQMRTLLTLIFFITTTQQENGAKHIYKIQKNTTWEKINFRKHITQTENSAHFVLLNPHFQQHKTWIKFVGLCCFSYTVYIHIYREIDRYILYDRHIAVFLCRIFLYLSAEVNTG